MKTIAAVLVLLFLVGNAFADKGEKTKTVSYKMKGSTYFLTIQHEDFSDRECVVTSSVSFYLDSAVTRDDGKTYAFAFTATYIIDYCGSFWYGTLDTFDPSVVTFVAHGVNGATVQGDFDLETFDGKIIPMSVNFRLWCVTPVEEAKEKTKEVNEYVKIIRKSTTLACGGNASGSVVVEGFDFLASPQTLIATLALAKDGEMTITRKVR